MTRLVQAPRVPVVPAVRPEPQLVLDVALGIAGAVVGTGVALGRAAVDLPLLHRRVIWRPSFVATRWQPASLLDDAARHGAARRAEMVRAAQALLDHWTPVIVELVVSRLDLTGLVIRHVDIDDVVEAVDIEAVVARLDLDAIVQRIDLDAAVAGVDLDAAVDGVDIDAIAGRLDLDAVIGRIDLIAMVRGGDRCHRPARHHPRLDRFHGVGDHPGRADDGNLGRRGHQQESREPPVPSPS